MAPSKTKKGKITEQTDEESVDAPRPRATRSTRQTGKTPTAAETTTKRKNATKNDEKIETSAPKKGTKRKQNVIDADNEAPAKASPKKRGRKKASDNVKELRVSIERTIESQIPNAKDDLWKKALNIYEFKANTINDKQISLDKYKGHVCIIVNVASRCGYTKANYEALVELYDKYSDEKGLRVLAFPCNQFGGQEPGDAAKICEFTKKKNVEFDVFAKIEVNGDNAHPLWKYLKEQKAGPKGKDISWNFTKFIIGKDGKVAERLQPGVKKPKLLEVLEKLW